MYCKKCGCELNNDAHFCYNCGNKIETQKAEKNETSENNDVIVQSDMELKPNLNHCPKGHLFDSSRYGNDCPYCTDKSSNAVFEPEKEYNEEPDVTLPLNKTPQVTVKDNYPERVKISAAASDNPCVMPSFSAPEKSDMEHQPVPVGGALFNGSASQPDSALSSSEGGKIWKALSIICASFALFGAGVSLICHGVIPALLFLLTFAMALPIRKAHNAIMEKTKTTFSIQLVITVIVLMLSILVFLFHMGVEELADKKIAGNTVLSNEGTEYQNSDGFSIDTENSKVSVAEQLELSEQNFSHTGSYYVVVSGEVNTSISGEYCKGRIVVKNVGTTDLRWESCTIYLINNDEIVAQAEGGYMAPTSIAPGETAAVTSSELYFPENIENSDAYSASYELVMVEDVF